MVHGFDSSHLAGGYRIGIGLLATVRGWESWTGNLKRLNYLPVFFTAAAISMGKRLGSNEGPQSNDRNHVRLDAALITNVYSVALIRTGRPLLPHFLGNELSMLATSMPPLLNFAKSSGIHPLPIALVWAFALAARSSFISRV